MAKNLGRAMIALCLLLAVAGSCSAALDAGSAAPDFTLDTMDGGTFTLSSNWNSSGKIVLLDFWASFCDPCKNAIPGLISISSDYASKGVLVVGVTFGDLATAYAYAREKGVNYTICGDQSMSTQTPYNVTGIPQTYIVDRAGIIRFAQTGYGGEPSDEAIRAALDQLTVPEPASSVAVLIGVVGVGRLAMRRRRF